EQASGLRVTNNSRYGRKCGRAHILAPSSFHRRRLGELANEIRMHVRLLMLIEQLVDSNQSLESPIFTGIAVMRKPSPAERETSSNTPRRSFNRRILLGAAASAAVGSLSGQAKAEVGSSAVGTVISR